MNKSPTTPYTRSGPLSILAACLISAGIALYQFSTLRPSGSEPPAAAEENDMHGAWACMQILVKKRLKSPSSASFPFGGAQGVTPLGSGRYRVSSYVDAQNSFGATLRQPFTGVIRRVGDGWQLESFEFAAGAMR